MVLIYNHGDNVGFDKTSVALGTFDGVHIAHVNIINKAKDIAKENNLKCGIVTFDEIPANIVSNMHTLKLMNLEDKLRAFPEVDFVYIEKFDKDFMNLSPEEFVGYLKNKVKAAIVTVGYNYHFGRNGAGDVQLLKSLCEKAGIQVHICKKEEIDGEPVSSTRIRKLIMDGKVENAEKLLGRPFRITGTVMQGLQNGKKMGIPTANILPKPDIVSVKQGVYAGICEVEDKVYKSVINVGNNPTFKAKNTTIECHLLDFDGDIYNKTITVMFSKFIREEICFDSPDALANQILNDIKVAKNVC